MRILMWLREDDRRRLEAAGPWGRATWIACHSVEDVCAAAEGERVGCFLLDAAFASDWLRDDRSHALLSSAPLVLSMTLTPKAAREVIDAAAWLPRGHVSLQGFDDLSDDVAQLLENDVDPTPELRLMKSIGHQIVGTLRAPVVAATILGRRRTRLIGLARACAVAPRTIEWRLNRFSHTNARSLLGWSLALHTLWRLDVLNWPLKRCAAAAGFADGSTLSDYVERHVGCRPQRIRADGGFEALHRRWRTLLRDTWVIHRRSVAS